MKGYCDKCKKVIDETEIYRFGESIVCHECYVILKASEKENKRFLIMKEGVIYDLNKIDIIEGLKLDFFRADYYLNRKESKPYLCQFCKLNETCQNNFDYECIEASDILFDILFKPKSKVYTVKDDFLDSLIDKDHNALRG